MIDLDGLLLVGSAVLLVAVLAARVGASFGLPALLLFLGLGMVIGEAGLGIRFDDADLAHALGFGALVLILAEGGLTTRWNEIRASLTAAGLLATVGTGVSLGATALFAHYVLGLDPWLAVLLGAVCSPTDAAAVFAVLRRVPLPHRLRGTLEAESGLNDAPTVLLVALASEAALGNPPAGGVLGLVGLIALELVGGVAIGLALGWLGAQVLRRVALPASGLYPLAAVGWSVLAYGLGSAAHTSGFAAVYVCALVLGNSALPHRSATRSFVEGIGWIAQIGLFVMLGLLASPGRLTWHAVGIALAAGAFLTVVARPLSVLVSVIWFRLPLSHLAFTSWAGLRGAVPIVLTTIPLSAGVPGSDFLFDVVLVFVIVFTLVQAPTLAPLARRLGLGRGVMTDIEVESAPLDKVSANLLQIRIPVDSQLHGVMVSELRLPRNAVVSLIIRGEDMFAPSGRQRLRSGDELLIVTPTALTGTVERRLRAVGRRGRLANWWNESGGENG
ncbi:potassium/proton antiporter [Auraticoccus monumenti]|uniref:Potassium/proton antiporter, CPA1 family n=1 Tax=Auraticoccus monumenti TaxID=675864 RepID=A0A1G6SBD8_9ACTN|nr:potassium/proton antiporter [Auraticoccus monumenti]SDD13964.1 potassium/proton antiporter, CPA1 family [Auraticoccus monumenti]